MKIGNQWKEFIFDCSVLLDLILVGPKLRDADLELPFRPLKYDLQ
jgi:hypothetical protein